MAHHASATALKRKCPEDEETAPGMCTNNCGFHGAAATGNMCSKCYREHLLAAASDATAETSVFIAPAASTAPPEKKAKTIVSSAASSDDAESSFASTKEELAMAAHHDSATAQKRKCPEAEETAGMCTNGCGFHGSAATGNMCSKCYREHVAAASDTTAAESVFIAPAASAVPPEKKAKTIVSAASSDGADELPAASTLKQPTAATNRCATCRKKVGLLGFRCRCEGTFCSVHRYSEKHDCCIDFKTAGREKIAKLNPVVVADKMATRI